MISRLTALAPSSSLAPTGTAPCVCIPLTSDSNNNLCYQNQVAVSAGILDAECCNVPGGNWLLFRSGSVPASDKAKLGSTRILTLSLLLAASKSLDWEDRCNRVLES